MALEIIWTPTAEKGYEKIISYLENNWTEREVENFIVESFRFFELLSEHPEILEKSGKLKNVYRGPIDKHNILTYRINSNKKKIELLNIRSSRQKPLNE